MSSPMLNRRYFLTLGTGMATLMAQGALHGSVAPGQKHLRRAKALGTKVKFTVFHPEQKRANRASDAAFDKIEHVEQLMSLYRTDSQLSLLNRQGALRNPHPDLVTALKKSIELSRRTGGAIDVTVQPLWKLYSDRAASTTLPAPLFSFFLLFSPVHFYFSFFSCNISI